MRANSSSTPRQDTGRPVRPGRALPALGPDPRPTSTLIGPLDPSSLCIFWGADRLGRDMLSRVIHGTRISMTIGLDRRQPEPLLRHPARRTVGLLWRAGRQRYPARHRVPARDPDHSALDGPCGGDPALDVPGAGLFHHHHHPLAGRLDRAARVIRGRFLAIKNEDFVVAARLDGTSELGIILRHMAPCWPATSSPP